MTDITAQEPRQYTPGEHPDLPPPSTAIGVIAWMREHLFSSWFNTILTVLLLYFIYDVVSGVFQWAVVDATFTGSSAKDCTGGGACWPFVTNRFGQFMYGFYPEDQRWRVNLGYAIAVIAMIPLFIEKVRNKGWILTFLLVVYPFIAFYLFHGGSFFGLLPEGSGLEIVETARWGGLMVTLVIAVTGIVASFPLGILLALGRRSKLPAIKTFCIVFIELWRGVPLISVLFMASVMLPLFLPPGITFDKLLRALIGVSLFSSAYMAEVVRGGLQAIPKGQTEAAQALGLSYWKTMRLVILPQALKLVIPGIVSTFIGLFKDTTLVLIIGLFDLLGIVQVGLTDANWLGESVPVTGYVFAAFSFWIFCFGMSRYSMHLERKLHTGHKR